VYAPRAASVALVLHGGSDGDDGKTASPDIELPMTRTGDVWHLHVDALPRSGVRYGYRVVGEPGTGPETTGHRWRPDRVLLDPYAPLVAGRREWALRDAGERFVLDVSCWFHGHD
jgi:isoamylase